MPLNRAPFLQRTKYLNSERINALYNLQEIVWLFSLVFVLPQIFDVATGLYVLIIRATSRFIAVSLQVDGDFCSRGLLAYRCTFASVASRFLPGPQLISFNKVSSTLQLKSPVPRPSSFQNRTLPFLCLKRRSRHRPIGQLPFQATKIGEIA